MPRTTALACALAATTLLAACGGGGGDAGESRLGTLRLGVTDAPACGFETVHVTVDKVRVHRSATAGDTDIGWQEIVLPVPRRIDLLSLVNGAFEELGETLLPAGRYTQMRLVLVPNSATPLANAVDPVGPAGPVALDTPSATQSGLKFNIDIEVQPGQVADFLIDFDACKSVVTRGSSGRYNLKPVLAVIPRLSEAGARIVGYVAPALAGATVSVQSAGVPLRSTVPDPATGRFDLWPVPAGTHTVVISGGGAVTGVVTGVPVVTEQYTYLNERTSPIMLPAATPRTVAGSVTITPPLEPTAVLARATQSLTGGPTVEVVARPVDTGGGPFEFALPMDAPRVAPFVTAAPGPTFAPDDGARGSYTVEAVVLRAGGDPPLRKALTIELRPDLPDPPALGFVFP